jgi:mono/diheme cytochrome c family protein
VIFAAVLALGACTGDTGPVGPNGPAGTNGNDGMNGIDGTDGTNGSNGNDIIISDTAKHGLDISPVAVDTSGKTAAEIEAIGQGSYLINALADCGQCHGEAGSTPGFLGGTTNNGNFNARNLTPDATTGMQLTEDQFVDVMRNGTNYLCSGGTCTADTHTLKVMPWADYKWASKPDLKAIYAYLRAIPAVSNQVHADMGTLGGAPGTDPTQYDDGAVVRDLPVEEDAMGNPIPDPGFARRGKAIQPLDSVDSTDAITDERIGRGAYLVTAFGGCNKCHTNPSRTAGKITVAAYLTGGAEFSINATVQASTGTVRSMSANLVGASGYFGETDALFTSFEGILQTGVHIDDSNLPVLAAPMPWQHLRNLTVEDLAAIYTYLQNVQAVHHGTLTDKAVQDPSYYCAADADCDALNGGTTGIETCDTTAHECIGRTCAVDSDCRVCQTCSGATSCVASTLTATCSAGI